MFKKTLSKKGFSLVEVLVVSAILVLVFGGLFTAFNHSLKLIAESRAKLTALSLVTDRLEYLRSLPYDDVGTVSGIPTGLIPQNRTINLNDLDFDERVLIEYVDDPADGTGASDNNGILADYKKIKIEYSWTINGTNHSFFMISNVVPRSIESTAGGGSLRVNVFDANVSPLSGIDVRLYNNTTTSTIDVTRSTDASGVALFTGAPAASNYQIFVSANGYSSDQTRQATTSLPNPSTLPISILEGDVSTMNFQVDKVSDLSFELLTNRSIMSEIEQFNNFSGTSVVSSTTISGGNLVLTDNSGIYDSSGYVMLDPNTPSSLVNWGVVGVTALTPTDTDVKIRFYTSTSTSDLVPDGDLPGNSIGFSDRYIDLRELDPATYPTLVVGVFLSTSDTSVSPTVDEINLPYVDSVSYLSGFTANIRGDKTIGTLVDASPVYKYDISTTTDTLGRIDLKDIEWDVYTLSLGGFYVVKDACPASPYNLSPNTAEQATYLLSPTTANSLRLKVVDVSGDAIIGATVELIKSGLSQGFAYTSWCGQVYFDGLASDTDYELNISANEYISQNISPYSISNTQVEEIILLQ
ncbi:MAG: prepilin-type N-terminal cleavage/methylation domain-containing protein [Candidatus Paceibacterota bacterium]